MINLCHFRRHNFVYHWISSALKIHTKVVTSGGGLQLWFVVFQGIGIPKFVKNPSLKSIEFFISQCIFSNSNSFCNWLSTKISNSSMANKKSNATQWAISFLIIVVECSDPRESFLPFFIKWAQPLFRFHRTTHFILKYFHETVYSVWKYCQSN